MTCFNGIIYRTGRFEMHVSKRSMKRIYILVIMSAMLVSIASSAYCQMKIDSISIEGVDIPLAHFQNSLDGVPECIELTQPVYPQLHFSFKVVESQVNGDSLSLIAQDTTGSLSHLSIKFDTFANVIQTFQCRGVDGVEDGKTDYDCWSDTLNISNLPFINSNGVFRAVVSDTMIPRYAKYLNAMCATGHDEVCGRIIRSYTLSTCCYFLSSSKLSIAIYGNLPLNFVHPLDGNVSTYTISPNPVSLILHIRDVKPNDQITLFNLLGETVRSEKVSAGQTNLDIDVHDLPMGMYVLRVGAESRKIIIQ
jgi:hypothetical protein